MVFAKLEKSQNKQVLSQKRVKHTKIIIIFFLLIVVVTFYLYRHFVWPPQLKMPTYLKKSAVLVDSDFIAKSLLSEDNRLGTVTDIIETAINRDYQIRISGTRGAISLDKEFNLISSVIFNRSTAYTNIIDVNKDNTFEYLNRGSCRCCNPSLIDNNGNQIWSYNGTSCIHDASAGDINGDGKFEFIVGFNGKEGVHLLNETGNIIWKKLDNNVWHIEIVDVNGDGIPEIVHSNASGEIVIRDRFGEILSKNKPDAYFADFSIAKWPSKQDREYLLLSENDFIWILDFSGEIVAKLDAPKCGTQGHARGEPVKLKNNQPEYFAVIVEFGHWRRSILYVYDPDGELVYQEIFPEVCASISAVDLDRSGLESILIGCKGKVWKYSSD